MPVTTQIKRTDTVAPITSALCHPKFILTEAGLEAIHIENKEMRKEAKSVNKWAASVAMARLFAMIPPAINKCILKPILFFLGITFLKTKNLPISKIMNARHSTLAMINLFRAFLSIPPSRSV